MHIYVDRISTITEGEQDFRPQVEWIRELILNNINDFFRKLT